MNEKPPVHASAVELVDKMVICPACGKPAVLRRKDGQFAIECAGEHEAFTGLRPETSLVVAPQ